jgi:hypothetical protein
LDGVGTERGACVCLGAANAEGVVVYNEGVTGDEGTGHLGQDADVLGEGCDEDGGDDS